MSPRRRAALLLGLALALGSLAASDVARREAAIHRQLGPLVPVLVARARLPRGAPLTPERLAVRRVPARFAPAGALSSFADVAGRRTSVAVAAGGDLSAAEVADGSPSREGDGEPIRPGERIAEVVAQGSPTLIVPGSRVDVLVTREGRGAQPGGTVLALQDVEVLAAAATPADAAPEGTGPRVEASLRVTLRQAVYLAAAQSFARELRLLPRAPGDTARVPAGVAIDDRLGS